MQRGSALRPARPGDAAALAAIHRAGRAVALPGLHEPHAEAAVAHWLAHALLARHRVMVAADARDAPQGYLGLSATGEVLHLYVAPSCHRRGLGSALLDWAKASSPGGLTLACFQRNRAALAFYRRHGFRIVATRGAAANEEGEPDAICAWSPPPPDPSRGENA